MRSLARGGGGLPCAWHCWRIACLCHELHALRLNAFSNGDLRGWEGRLDITAGGATSMLSRGTLVAIGYLALRCHAGAENTRWLDYAADRTPAPYSSHHIGIAVNDTT